MENKIKYKKLEIVDEKKENIDVIDKTQLIEINEEFRRTPIINGTSMYIGIRNGSCLSKKAIYLPEISCDWVLGKDDEDLLCLVPLRRNEK